MSLKFIYYEHLNLVVGLCFIVFAFSSCTVKNPNTSDTGNNILKEHEVDYDIKAVDTEYQDTVYVPVYSDIYFNLANQKNLLSATLSIRNTSFTDSLFVSNIDYYNTDGDLVKSFLDQPIFLKPMASIDYVIPTEDDTGGRGANFIVFLSSSSPNILPIIQTVMIGTDGNKAIAFTADGKSVSSK